MSSSDNLGKYSPPFFDRSIMISHTRLNCLHSAFAENIFPPKWPAAAI
jgi:hypothetical protein